MNAEQEKILMDIYPYMREKHGKFLNAELLLGAAHLAIEDEDEEARILSDLSAEDCRQFLESKKRLEDSIFGPQGWLTKQLQTCSWTGNGEYCNQPATVECSIGELCAPSRKWCAEHYEEMHLPEEERKGRGAPKGNDHAMHGDYHRMMVSLSGPNYDKIRRHLAERGIPHPSGKEVVQAMNNARLDWGQFGFEYNDPAPEEEAQRKQKEAEKSALGVIRADYRYIKECEILSIEKLRDIVADAPSATADEHYHRRHRQAQIVLEARETGYDPLAPRIC